MEQNFQNKWKIQIKYSRNTRLKLEVKTWGIIITIPEGLPKEKVYKIIDKHRPWLEKKYAELLEAIELSKNIKITNRSDAELRSLAEKLVQQATEKALGMNLCRLAIRKMKTRWASCSPKGTITLNSIAKYLPEHLISYIIYHEVCHILEPKHNTVFWQCVQKHYPNYRELEKELLAYEIKLGLHTSTTHNQR